MSSVLDTSINYSQYVYDRPQYKFQQVMPNQFGSPINVNSSLNQVTFNLPVNVMNLSRSYIMGTLSLPATAARHNWIFRDIPFREFQHIQLYASNQNYLVDLDNVQNYMKIMAKKEVSLSDYKSMDPLYGIAPSNTVNNAVPALRHNNATIAGVPTPSANLNPSSINYDEPAYFEAGALATDASYNFCYPFRLLKHTLFAMDKSIYTNQILYVRCYVGPIGKVAYASQSPNSPSAGTPEAYTGAAEVQNLQIMVAVDTNNATKERLISEVNSPNGKSFYIPFTQANTFSNSGPNQSLTLQIDSGQGDLLERVIHSVFNTQQSLDTAYDCANNAIVAAGCVNAQKIINYYTQIDGQRLQDLTITCQDSGGAGIFTDYMQQKRCIQGSVLQNLSVYQYNWFHEDDFDGYNAKVLQSDNDGGFISGLRLTGKQRTWQIIANMATTNTVGTTITPSYQHYNWCVYQRELIMKGGSITTRSGAIAT